MTWTTEVPTKDGLYWAYNPLTDITDFLVLNNNRFHLHGALLRFDFWHNKNMQFKAVEKPKPDFVKIAHNHKTFPGKIGDTLLYYGSKLIIAGITYDGVLLVKDGYLLPGCVFSGKIHMSYTWNDLTQDFVFEENNKPVCRKELKQ
jgi:hypothetical protein